MPDLPFAHDVDYWKTGTKRTPAQWIDLAVAQIRDHGGTSIVQASGEQEGHEAYMIGFYLSEDHYKIVWPVLPVRWNAEKDRVAARRQAATTLYHDVKAHHDAALAVEEARDVLVGEIQNSQALSTINSRLRS